MQGGATQARLQALETRQAAMEAAVTALVQILGPRSEAALPQQSGSGARQLTPVE